MVTSDGSDNDLFAEFSFLLVVQGEPEGSPLADIDIMVTGYGKSNTATRDINDLHSTATVGWRAGEGVHSV